MTGHVIMLLPAHALNVGYQLKHKARPRLITDVQIVGTDVKVKLEGVAETLTFKAHDRNNVWVPLPERDHKKVAILITFTHGGQLHLTARYHSRETAEKDVWNRVSKNPLVIKRIEIEDLGAGIKVAFWDADWEEDQ